MIFLFEFSSGIEISDFEKKTKKKIQKKKRRKSNFLEILNTQKMLFFHLGKILGMKKGVFL